MNPLLLLLHHQKSRQRFESGFRPSLLFGQSPKKVPKKLKEGGLGRADKRRESNRLGGRLGLLYPAPCGSRWSTVLLLILIPIPRFTTGTIGSGNADHQGRGA
jgi:hypothetical protein